MSVKRYNAAGYPCVDGDYIHLFQEGARELCGLIVDIHSLPGGPRNIHMARPAAHMMVLNFLEVSVMKHGVNTMVLGGHLCCGGYEDLGLSLSDEEELQREHFQRARRFLADQVPLAVGHYLREREFKKPEHKQHLLDLQRDSLTVVALLVKPRDMTQRITDPPSQCYVEQVF